MAFIDDARKKFGDYAILCEIALTQPSARTLYLTDRAATYGGTVYEERLVSIGLTGQRADILTGEIAPLSASFTVQNRKLNYQTTAAKTFGDVLSTYAFAGAAVTFTLWHVGVGTSQILFKGYITEIARYDDSEVEFNLTEQYKWDVTIPPTVIERAAFPEAPDDNMGRRVPLHYGDFTGATYSGYPILGEHWPVAQAICVDKSGPDHGRPVIRVCDNDGTSAAHTLGTDPLRLWDDALGELTTLKELGYPSPTNSIEKVEMEFDQNPYGEVCVIPTGIGDGNTASDPAKAMDRNHTTYTAIMDAQILSLTIPNTGNPGILGSITVYIYWDDTSASGTLKYGLWDVAASDYHQSTTIALPGVEYDLLGITTLLANWREWRFVVVDISSNEFPLELRAEFVDDTGYCRITGMALWNRYDLKTDVTRLPWMGKFPWKRVVLQPFGPKIRG